MIGESLTSDTRLATSFGTALYVEPATGELRHGSNESVPNNVTFSLEAEAAGKRRYGSLFRDDGETRAPIACLPDGSLFAVGVEKQASSEMDRFHAVPLTPALIGLRSETGRYLCAEPDGRITISRARCSLWEVFAAAEDWYCGLRGQDELDEEVK